jgi:hypothetical protein
MNLEFEFKPENMFTMKICIHKSGTRYKTSRVTLPKDLVERYDMQDGDRVVMVFVKKVNC